MQERLKDLRARLRTISPSALIHVVMLELVVQAMWFGVSRAVANSTIRDAGFLVAFCVALLAVAWYLPRLQPRVARVTPTTRAPIEVESDGILWKHGGTYIGGGAIPHPFCRRHRVPLLYKNTITGELENIREAYQIDGRLREVYETVEGGLYCVGRTSKEGHLVKMTESRTWDEAERRASARLDTEISQHDSR
jgi:hypothetical protein